MTARVSGDITKDSAYNAVAPDDFPAMMEVDRYGKRSTAFDKIISATHDHFCSLWGFGHKPSTSSILVFRL